MNRKGFLITMLLFYITAGTAACIFCFRSAPALWLSPSQTEETALSAPPVPAPTSEAEPATVLPAPESSPMPQSPQPQYAYTASHTSQRLFIRSGPSLEAQIIGSLRPGDSGDVITPEQNGPTSVLATCRAMYTTAISR